MSRGHRDRRDGRICRSGRGVKLNPSLLARRCHRATSAATATTRGIHYSNGTRGPAGDIRAAAWSPDGTQVVFHKRLTVRPQAVGARPSAGIPEYELTLTGGGPSFSPDGDRFAIRRAGRQNAMGAGVAVADAGGDNVQVVYRDPTRNILGPQWSPDGERIIFGIGDFNAFFNGFHGQFLKPEDRAEGGAQIADRQCRRQRLS